MPIKALIFDFDGLIVDTETPEVVVWEKLYSEHGAEFPIDRWSEIIGGAGAVDFDAAGHLVEISGNGLNAEDLRRQHRTLSEALTMTQPMLPGVMQMLEEARGLKLHLAIASSSPHAWVDMHAKRLGLFERFDHIVCSDDVPAGRTKPNPDLFQLALDKLGVEAREAIALEDSPNGLRAARAAGIFTVTVPNPSTVRLRFDAEDMRVNSLADLHLTELIGMISGL
jgi:HAD superfamily hydrolase (TIGR01509 family)